MTIAIDFVLVIAAVLTALMAGLFYAWSCSVMPGLTKASDREFVSFMQKANRAIQNPVFFVAFLGAPLLLPLSAILHYGQAQRFWYLLAASLIYLAGNFGVTVLGNVPLNVRLDRFDSDAASDAEISAQRAAFERRWTNLNHVRAISSTVALLLVVIACLY